MVADRCSSFQDSETFVYRFDGIGGRNAIHGWEVPFAFGNMVGGMSNVQPLVDFSHEFVDVWASFIATGRPCLPESWDGDSDGDDSWKPWSAASNSIYRSVRERKTT